MSPSPAAIGLGLLAITVLLAGGWAWLVALLKLVLTRRWIPQPAAEQIAEALRGLGVSPRLPLVEFTPRRPVPWAFFDLAALFAIWLIGSAVGGIALRQAGWLSESHSVTEMTLAQQQTLILGNAAISLLLLGAGLPLIAWRTGAAASDFGWSPRELLTDIRLGLIGFVMLAPPVYAMQGLLVQFWQPSKHPLVEMFKAAPDPWFFVLLVIAAAVVAPLFEELIFRVLLQGFVEKAVSFRGSALELFFGDFHGAEMPIVAELADPPLPATLPFGSRPPAPSPQPLPSGPRGPAAFLPIAISSIIFALMHYSHGPDWIPLTFLAAGMGYLYQRTHRLLPSLIVHVLINSSSLLALWVQVFDVQG